MKDEIKKEKTCGENSVTSKRKRIKRNCGRVGAKVEIEDEVKREKASRDNNGVKTKKPTRIREKEF